MFSFAQGVRHDGCMGAGGAARGTKSEGGGKGEEEEDGKYVAAGTEEQGGLRFRRGGAHSFSLCDSPSPVYIVSRAI